MATAQTSGRQAIEITTVRARPVLEHEPQRDTPRSRGSTDRELWSPQLSWLLAASASALGQRGTMAAVISAIERGGSSGSSAYDHFTDQQLGGRWGRKPGEAAREGDVERRGRLGQQWGQVPLEHQRVLLAHYLASSRQIAAATGYDNDAAVVEGKFGELTGVVTFLWCRRQADRRVRAQQGERVTLQRAGKAVRLELQRLEERLWMARLAARERPEDGEAVARVALLCIVAKVTADGLARLQASDAVLARESDQRADVARLVEGCAKGGKELVDKLRAGAERHVRAAHRAWYEAGVRQEERELVG
jgi:hypothetical protein